ncbi:MAG: hypothetical protein AUK25_08865 [Desulfobacteraceae bacterium CG2_30_51_40]|nr:MAG: hypothetical protein AUK25_08865 [Desulfobacteraceae bacterium CG2_30_51_40]
MNKQRLSSLKERLFFTARDVAYIYNIALPSAHVLCSRYMKDGVFIRLKKDFYVLDSNLERYGEKDFFSIANMLQAPSYISLMTALCFYEITTQVQPNWYESISQRRSTQFDRNEFAFKYHRIKSELYFGFVRSDTFFIAEAEKALLDAAYLVSLNRYSLDWNSLDTKFLDISRLKDLMTPFPDRVKKIIAERCRI